MKPLPPRSPNVRTVSPTSRRNGLLLLVVLVVVALAASVALWPGRTAAPALPQPRQVLIDVADGPGGQQRAQLDATLYAPADTPAPAVVLAHGIGGDKNTSAAQARELARRGFAVLTYSARGFGASTGRIALNSPEYEVTDARQIVDWLARQPEVLRDADGDPRVGVTGDSYGGALSLLLAGTDPRVDSIAPVMTYNDLGQALLPNSASRAPIPADSPARSASSPQGVFKRAWAELLFSAGATRQGADSGGSAGPSQARATPTPPATCGNFQADVCAAYTELARTGRASQRTLDLLAAASPKSTGPIRVPTLLVQGERDTLFGLDQAEANARQITDAGGLVKLVWFAGGHDGDPPGPRVHAKVADWFAFHLGLPGPQRDPGSGFEYDVPGTPRRDGEIPVRTVAAPAYPGLAAERTPRFSLPLRGAAATVVNPPGGSPGSTSSLPAAGAAQHGDESAARDLPGQVAAFRTDPASSRTLISGAAQTRLSVSSVPGQPATGDAVLFAKLYDIDPAGRRDLLGDSAAPMHVTGLSPDGKPSEVNVSLPGVVHSLEPGHRLELAVTTTDQAYATPVEPSVHRVALTGNNAVSVPSVRGTTVSAATFPFAPLAGAGAVVLLALLAWGASRLRGRAQAPDEALAEVPLQISELHKTYPHRITALSGLSLQVQRGQVVGLLGPNGAGKTTTLRTLLGLLRPDSGSVRVFGHPVRPGAPVLSRVGSLVESPGFLPHLSGLENLKNHWAATGRPALQARFDEVLQMTGLDEHADRRTATLSRGMRQRLAIAQAMLGLPDLLVLDEPLNGLDPPQIHRLREILRRYAETGRSVLISSHLLSEIEQTCTHVVVLHRGEVVTAGAVDDVVALDGQATFRVDDPEQAAESLRRLEGLGAVEVDGDLLHADLAGQPRSVAVNVLVASGVAISQVGPRRRLEDAFLDLVGEERR
ncbi:alpha/beta fold hydrolase [Saccharopolyspora sp. HNM0986]|uniref:alpha/beta fold hydrolase n=1 Tax=Saccharopolyspora galaxeae TaxID=2781241 RepID=UPI001909F005|nr:alpha/beta fold hydrolase [Saccharopolyspora sp. HNM0986]